MNEYKIVAGYLSIIVAVFVYIPYLKGILKGKIKPHAFSWLVWSFLVGIIFAAQVVKEGGAGAWAAGSATVVCFVIFILALVKGERKFAVFDWISLAAACVALLLWQITNDPTLSVILVGITDCFAFLPTLRKGIYKPHEDSVVLWGFTSMKWLFSIIALESYSFVTLFYPIYVCTVNIFFAILLFIKQSGISRQHP